MAQTMKQMHDDEHIMLIGVIIWEFNLGFSQDNLESLRVAFILPFDFEVEFEKRWSSTKFSYLADKQFY